MEGLWMVSLQQETYALVGLLVVIVGWQYVKLKSKEDLSVTKLEKVVGDLTVAMSSMTESFRGITSDMQQRLHDQEFRCEHKVDCRFEEALRDGTIVEKDRRKRPRDKGVVDRRSPENDGLRTAMEKQLRRD